LNQTGGEVKRKIAAPPKGRRWGMGLGRDCKSGASPGPIKRTEEQGERERPGPSGQR